MTYGYPTSFFFNLKGNGNENKNVLKTYLIEDGANGVFKIGKTINVQQRFNSLKTANPNIKIILVINGFFETELHEKYKKKQISGEWFSLSKKDIKDIIQQYSNFINN
jgi:hypothetical protein